MAPQHILLFQYGSNMDPARLNSVERLNHAAEVIGMAQLRGWGVRFDLYSKDNECAVTDIVPRRNERVQGVLYKVPYRVVVAPRGERSAMDRIEGAGLSKKSNYKRLKISVHMGKKRITARTYVGMQAGRNRFRKRSNEERRVSADYFRHLLTGAKRFRMNASYVAYLRKQKLAASN